MVKHYVLRLMVDGRRVDVSLMGALAEAEHIESMSLVIDDAPVVTVPFYAHGTTLHTVCRENGIVDTVEW